MLVYDLGFAAQNLLERRPIKNRNTGVYRIIVHADERFVRKCLVVKCPGECGENNRGGLTVLSWRLVCKTASGVRFLSRVRRLSANDINFRSFDGAQLVNEVNMAAGNDRRQKVSSETFAQAKLCFQAGFVRSYTHYLQDTFRTNYLSSEHKFSDLAMFVQTSKTSRVLSSSS